MSTIEEMYGITEKEFEVLLERFMDNIADFSTEEHAEMKTKGYPPALIFNLILNGLTNYAVHKYAEIRLDNGLSAEEVRADMLEHMSGIFDAAFVNKKTQHRSQEIKDGKLV